MTELPISGAGLGRVGGVDVVVVEVEGEAVVLELEADEVAEEEAGEEDEDGHDLHGQVGLLEQEGRHNDRYVQ